MNDNDVVRGQMALKKAADTALIFLLWVLMAVLGLLAIFALRDVIIWGVGALLVDTSGMPSTQIAAMISFANQCGAIILAVVAISAIIASFELIVARSKTPHRVRKLLIIIGVECAIIVPAGLAFWR